MKSEKKNIQRPFYKAGEWFAKKQLFLSGTGYKKVQQDLSFLYGKSEKNNAEKYFARKIALVLMVLFWGGGLCILAQIADDFQNDEVTAVKRPAYGQGEMQTDLQVQMEGENEKKVLSIRVQERQYTDKEIKKLFEGLKKTVEKTVQGKNVSLDEVREPLNFPASFENGSIEAEWFTDDPDLLDGNGNIVGEPKMSGSDVEVRVRFKYRQWQDEHRFSVRIYPRERSQGEELVQSIEEAVAAADEASASKEELRLPAKVDGKKLYWRDSGVSAAVILAVFVLLTAVCVFRREDERIRNLVRRKQFELQMDYPAFLYKLTVLLRAGLTIRSAFEKIAENYRMSIKNGGNKNRSVYEEAVCCCNEMISGVPEAQAYENFGKRCRLPEYIRLGSVLSQNLKKGSQGLAAMLETEAAQSMEERRSLAKKLGEQAGTKLLFPMMLMLVIVMVILMVPAVMSFSVG